MDRFLPDDLLMKPSKTLIIALACIIAAVIFYRYGRALWHPVYITVAGKRTVRDVLDTIGPAAAARLSPHFDQRGLRWPPRTVTLIGIKDEERLELWAHEDGWVFVRAYEIMGSSGGPGPKLREGDGQVPEGVYSVTGLNPNSSFHLSFKLNYPNAFDRARAMEDKRTGLGGDIFIHGSNVSIGCLAMGDEAIEELFCLVATIGRENVTVIITPVDFRRGEPTPAPVRAVNWLDELYLSIQKRLDDYTGG